MVNFFKGIAGLLVESLESYKWYFASIESIRLGKLQIEMNEIEAKQIFETRVLRESLYDQEDLIQDYELRIAKLRLEIYNEKDEARRADLQKELDRLEAEKEGVVLNKDVTTKEIEKIEHEYTKRITKLKLEEWNRQKKLEIGMAVINGAQAFLKALTGAPPPFNFIMAGVVAAATAVQVGIIKSQAPPDFGDTGDVYMPGNDLGDSTGGGTANPGTQNEGGGYTSPAGEQTYGEGGILNDDSYFVNNGVLGGLRHNTPEGGNWVINPRTGKLLAKFEAGEFVGVFSREVTAKHEPLLRRLANSSLVQSGKPVIAETGYFGNLDSQAVDASNLAVLAKQDLGAINMQTAELIWVMQESKGVLIEVKGLLGDIAETSRVISEKNLNVSIRNIIDVADQIADVRNQSSFG